ncbi:MAG: phosphate acyltransferase PlsX [Candidatus Aminicenantes bacterium]|nr:phosphate acyltransferase PlsX [Candidatus Aminicenantes bacterium]
MKIAVDAMGGDFGPKIPIAGAIQASREFNIEVILVGAENIIHKEFDRLNHDRANISIINTAEYIGMGEGLISFRRKKRSSLRVCAQLVKEKQADAFISTGNSAAIVYISKKILGALNGVEKPALALLVPSGKGPTLLLDVGANANCRPRHLEQFAVMGHLFMQGVMGLKEPRIALMSIGEEKSKGNELTKEVFKMLKASPLNFVGNIEGKDIYSGKADVIVSDGFTGNIALKVSEGVVENFLSQARSEIMKNLFSKIGFFLMKRNLKNLYKRMDYSQYGGALLLGLNGICVVGHGRSNTQAVKNAIGTAKEFVANKVQEKIETEMDGFSQYFERMKA